MQRALRYLMVAAAFTMVGSSCSSDSKPDGNSAGKTTTSTAATSDDTTQDTSRDGSDTGKDTATPPDGAFPDGLQPADVKGVDDEPGDWGFYNGKDPGRSDDFVDFVHLWGGRVTASADDLAKVGTCGTKGDVTVACKGTPAAMAAGDYLVVTAQLAADAKQAATSGEAGRYSLLLDTAVEDAKKAHASAQAPDLAADQTDSVYEVLLGVTGEPPVSVNAVKVGAFVDTTARIVIHGRFVTWIIPMSDIGDSLVGVRAADVWGDAMKTGDPTKNDADVVPGTQHAPFTLLRV